MYAKSHPLSYFWLGKFKSTHSNTLYNPQKKYFTTVSFVVSHRSIKQLHGAVLLKLYKLKKYCTKRYAFLQFWLYHNLTCNNKTYLIENKNGALKRTLCKK